MFLKVTAKKHSNQSVIFGKMSVHASPCPRRNRKAVLNFYMIVISVKYVLKSCSDKVQNWYERWMGVEWKINLLSKDNINHHSGVGA
jgi:hypothetical protein